MTPYFSAQEKFRIAMQPKLWMKIQSVSFLEPIVFFAVAGLFFFIPGLILIGFWYIMACRWVPNKFFEMVISHL